MFCNKRDLHQAQLTRAWQAESENLKSDLKDTIGQPTQTSRSTEQIEGRSGGGDDMLLQS